MRKLLLLLLVTGACRDVDTSDHRNTEQRKPVESQSENDREFEAVRNHYATAARERLARLDERIRELEDEGTQSARETAARLRPERDRLAKQLDEIEVQAKAGWDQFQAALSQSFERVEKEVNDAAGSNQ